MAEGRKFVLGRVSQGLVDWLRLHRCVLGRVGHGVEACARRRADAGPSAATHSRRAVRRRPGPAA